MSIREIAEGLQIVGVDERPIFTLDTENWGGTPTAVAVTAYTVSSSTGVEAYTDVTATAFPVNTPTVVDHVITLSPFVPSTTAGTLMRIEIKFTSGGSIFEAYAMVEVER
jgi:hypothetical protein